MPKYLVTITYVISETREVEAEDWGQAEEIGEEQSYDELVCNYNVVSMKSYVEELNN